MKKKISLAIMIAGLTFVLAACGKIETKNEDKLESTSQTELSEETKDSVTEKDDVSEIEDENASLYATWLEELSGKTEFDTKDEIVSDDYSLLHEEMANANVIDFTIV